MDINTLRLDVARALHQICQSMIGLHTKIGNLKILPVTFRKFTDVGSIDEDVVDVTTVSHVLDCLCNEIDKRVTKEELKSLINEILDERESRQKPLDFGEADNTETLNSLVSASLQRTRS